jgi:hypothetical protein
MSSTFAGYNLADGERPSVVGEGTTAQAGSSWAEPREEAIPMESFPGEELEGADGGGGGDEEREQEEVMMAEDYVSLDTSPLPPSSTATAATPTYLQQPIVRRKGHDDSVNKDD